MLAAVALALLLCAGALAQTPLSDRSILSLLFDRPGEPIFIPQGENRSVVFVFPDKYLPAEYRGIPLGTRFAPGAGITQVTVPEIALPDLSLPEQLGRDDAFSSFVPYHRSMAGRLIEVLVGMSDYDDFITALLYAHARMNPRLVNYAQSVAILHRSDTATVPLPNFASIFPDRYFGGPGLFRRLREQAAIFTRAERAEEAPLPIEIPRDYTANDLEMEHRVAYFREDVGINLHHWHWHLVYPHQGPLQIVDKDRRGELFHYMHQQVIARYNFERLTNRLIRVQRFLNWREPIDEGYFPKLDSLVSSHVWPARPANTRLADLNRPEQQIQVDLQDLERWRERIFEAIHDGRVRNTNGSFLPLDEHSGIDILGNIVESSVLSINPNLYGNLHNLGHVMISLCHDPDGRHLETFAVMGDSSTAMRDPVFYRWHAFLNDIFQEHKATLMPYPQQQLTFNQIHISSVNVSTIGQNESNLLQTFWQQSNLDLSRGLDFAPRGPVFVRVTHLQHSPFTYNIRVNNSGNERIGTVRIFMAPRFDERGISLRLREQRLLFIELDKFQVRLRRGRNIIRRNSSESSVTIPYERTFRNLDENRPASGTVQEQQFNYCGCGWPDHMLIPKGTPEGYQAVLFVMVTNFADDQVNQRSTNMCRDGHSYCGIRGELYPDSRPMGFPFDRPPSPGVETLQIFTRPDNMATVNVRIQHIERVIPRA